MSDARQYCFILPNGPLIPITESDDGENQPCELTFSLQLPEPYEKMTTTLNSPANTDQGDDPLST